MRLPYTLPFEEEGRRKMVALKEHVLREPGRYFRIEDYFDPVGRKRLEAWTSKPYPGVSHIAWLYYERGLPREMLPFEVEWGGLGEKLFRFAAKQSGDGPVLERLGHLMGRRLSTTPQRLIRMVEGRYTDEEAEAIKRL